MAKCNQLTPLPFKGLKYLLYHTGVFSARCVRKNDRRAIATVRLSVCLSVCLSGTGVLCDHAVHASANLSLWLDGPMFWAP